ncbi:MAG: hypothetical protein ACKVOY_10395 [Burkholderiaceae bacterium]
MGNMKFCILTLKKMKTISKKLSELHSVENDQGASPDILMQLLDKNDATNRLLAKHPNASSELLERLSHSSDPATRKAVTSNPNTPTVVYIKLGQQFPKEFLTNPILDLLILENPDLLQEFSDNLLVQLVRKQECPEEFLIWASSHPSEKVQLAVAMNAKAPLMALSSLAMSKHKKVRGAIAQTQGLDPINDPEVAFRTAVEERLGSLELEEVQLAWANKDIGLPQWPFLPFPFRMETAKVDIWEIASNKRLPLEWLEKLSGINDPYIRIGVVQNPKVPIASIKAWQKNDVLIVRQAIAKDSKTPSDVLESLARDTEDLVRCLVAKNLNTEHLTLESLVHDKSTSVRSAVAKNDKLPIHIQEKLSKDSDYSVRVSVALNPNTSQAVLARLAEDKDINIVAHAAGNPNTERGVLESLAKATDALVRSYVGQNPKASKKILEELANDNEAAVRAAVANNPNTSATVLKALAASETVKVRKSVAENPNTDPLVLEILAKDADASVRVAVAINPRSSTTVLDGLAKDNAGAVRSSVAANANGKESTIGDLALDDEKKVAWCAINNPNIPKSFLLALSKHYKTKEVRLALAAHPRTPIEVLAKLAKDNDWEIRSSVAGNLSLTQPLLASMMCEGENEAVLSALLQNPSSSQELVAALAKIIIGGDPHSSAWYLAESVSASTSVKLALQGDDVLHFCGKNPNITVLSRRPTGVLFALCSDQKVEPSRIAKVAGSTDWLIRAAVARNTSTPPNMLKKLSVDTHPLVTALANQRLNREYAKSENRSSVAPLSSAN